MSKIIPVLVAVLVLSGFHFGVKHLTKNLLAKVSVETLNPGYAPLEVPKVQESLEPSVVKVIDTKKTLVLEATNTVTLRGPVTPDSVAATMRKLDQVSQQLDRNTPIYLVLDTPGGSIIDGMDLIDYAQALPQKVHTVTLFAASMGFQIAQNLNTRYIIRSGQLMSHRAAVSGVGGQIKGEFESRYKMIRRTVDYLDFKAYTRLGITAKQYEDLVVNEYWIWGYDAVAAKAADEQVLVKCGTSLQGSEVTSFNTIFGKVDVTFSNCPLIKAPEKINVEKIADLNKQEVLKVLELAISDKAKFVHDYISTNKFYEFFR